MCFHEDGATDHISLATLNGFHVKFTGCIISCYGVAKCPPRSNDLTLSDFFLRLLKIVPMSRNLQR